MGHEHLPKRPRSSRQGGYTEADLLQAQFRTAILLIGVLFIGRQCARFGDGIIRGCKTYQDSKTPAVTAPMDTNVGSSN